MAGENLIDVPLVNMDDKEKKCPHFNRGFCNYAKTECTLQHPKEKCYTQDCKTEQCPKRHSKKCKYGTSCTHLIRKSFFL